MSDILLNVIIQILTIAVLVAGLYFIGKKLLDYSNHMDKKIIQETRDEVHHDIVEVYWPLLNQLFKDGFTVPDILPEVNDRTVEDLQRDHRITKVKHPELFNADGSDAIELPIKHILK